MYEALRRNGKTVGIRRIDDDAAIPISLENRDYAAFLEWEKENGPLDLSDKAPDPVPEDADKAPIDALISKDPGDWSALELRQAVALVLKRVRKGM